MTDLYTKIVLTIIAVATVANLFVEKTVRLDRLSTIDQSHVIIDNQQQHVFIDGLSTAITPLKVDCWRGCQ